MTAWIKITSGADMPQKDRPGWYEQYDCLVFHKGEIKHLVWNCEHLCWDDSSGDDFYCDPLEPSHYMLFPESPERDDAAKNTTPADKSE